MSTITVIGGGFGGMSSAARLAKLGHQVTLVESSASLGGALSSVSSQDFTWDAGPTATLLPAVIRDLFRKSGRPLEREVDLQPLPISREHRFADGTTLALPGGSRAAQLNAVDELKPGHGQQWVDYVATYGETWEILRKEWFERAWDADVAPRELTKLLASRESLHKKARRAFTDERLRLIATHCAVAAGHNPRNVPAWQGITSYLEQRFGTWTVPGGLAALGTAMAERLTTRGVRVLTNTRAEDLIVRSSRVVAVSTSAGEIAADQVVVAVDPRRLPTLAPYVERTMPAFPPVICHLGLEGDVPALAHEVVLHGDPLLIVHTGGRAPDGHHAWTIHGRGRLDEDIVTSLARRRLDVRRQIVERIDRSPRDLVELWGGSPHGVAWRGPRTAFDRLGPRTPIAGVLSAGASATTGSGLPFVGLSAAVVAELIGRA